MTFYLIKNDFHKTLSLSAIAPFDIVFDALTERAGQEDRANLAERQAPSHLDPQSEADCEQRGEQEGAGGEGAGATTADRGAETSDAL